MNLRIEFVIVNLGSAVPRIEMCFEVLRYLVGYFR